MAAIYEESRVVGREHELGKIRSFFSEHIESWSGGSLYVCGRSGTGKTEAVKQVFNGLRVKVSNDLDIPAKGHRAKKTKFTRTIRLVWTMGTSTSGTSFLFNLAKDCGIKVTKNLDVSLEDAFGKRREDVLYIVVTDEIDLLPADVVRRMFNWATENSSLLLLGIANVVNAAGSRLFRFDQNVPQELPFEPYKVVELKPIIEKKLGEDLARFDPKALELCIRKAEKNSSGDVRTCLSWCDRLLIYHKSMEAAAGTTKLIGLADVVRVTGPTETPQSRRIQSLPAQSRFALVACVVAHRKQQQQSSQKQQSAHQGENPLVVGNDDGDQTKEDEWVTFDEWIGEKILKESWQMLREVWKIPTEGNLQDHLDRLRENDVIAVQTKKVPGKKTGNVVSYKIKANSKDIETALLGDDANENDNSNFNVLSSSSCVKVEETASSQPSLAKRRPIYLAFKGIRPRVLANMHAVSS